MGIEFLTWLYEPARWFGAIFKVILPANIESIAPLAGLVLDVALITTLGYFLITRLVGIDRSNN